MATRDRGTLSSKIPADELIQALNQASLFAKTFEKRVLSAEILLYTYLKMPDTQAYRILKRLADQRAFNWASFEDEVYRAAKTRLTRDVNFDFKTDAQERIPLGDDILYMIDEGYSLAKTRLETKCNTAHTLVYPVDRLAPP